MTWRTPCKKAANLRGIILKYAPLHWMSSGKGMISRIIIIFCFFFAVLDLRHCAGFSLVAKSWGYSPVVACGLFLVVVSLLSNSGSRHVRFSSRSTQALYLHVVLVAGKHVASSQIRDQTCAPCHAMADGFLSTGPPQKSLKEDL